MLQAIPASPEQHPCYQLMVPLLSQFVLPLIGSVAFSTPVQCILTCKRGNTKQTLPWTGFKPVITIFAEHNS